jgi:hypothetical protein
VSDGTKDILAPLVLVWKGVGVTLPIATPRAIIRIVLQEKIRKPARLPKMSHATTKPTPNIANENCSGAC